jgi:hypothetical protein
MSVTWDTFGTSVSLTRISFARLVGRSINDDTLPFFLKRVRTELYRCSECRGAKSVAVNTSS